MKEVLANWWPQIFMIALQGFVMLVEVLNHGKEKTSKYNYRIMLWGLLFYNMVLYHGGFWK